MTKLALEVQGLRKSYGGLTVTDGVDLQLAAGSRHALIGPNGAGKSTLVNLISGVLRPDAGTISFFGQDITRHGASERTRIGLARTFQISSLFPSLSVLENVFLAVSEQKGAALSMRRPAGKRKDILDRAEGILTSLGLHGELHHRVSELAYGQQRLVDIALALALEPKVLLLDEPAAGIPSSEIGVLLDAIESLSSDIAILMIEHDMQIVRRFATTVTVLVQGKVLMSGPPQTVMTSEEVRSVYLGKTESKRATGENQYA
jgi:branched-chain amino acid transport system ATP-binding protein